MSRFRLQFTALLGLTIGALAACAIPAPAPTTTAFDGLYHGESRLVRGWGPPCGDPELPHEIRVIGGTMYFPFQANPPVTDTVRLPVAADGSFHGRVQYQNNVPTERNDLETAWMTVEGRISDGVLQATEADLRCTRQIVMRAG